MYHPEIDPKKVKLNREKHYWVYKDNGWTLKKGSEITGGRVFGPLLVPRIFEDPEIMNRVYDLTGYFWLKTMNGKELVEFRRGHFVRFGNSEINHFTEDMDYVGPLRPHHGYKWACDHCGAIEFEMVMVNDDLWKIISNDPYSILCLDCMELKLGRQITGADLKECGLTRSMKLGHTLFERDK